MIEIIDENTKEKFVLDSSKRTDWTIGDKINRNLCRKSIIEFGKKPLSHTREASIVKTPEGYFLINLLDTNGRRNYVRVLNKDDERYIPCICEIPLLLDEYLKNYDEGEILVDKSKFIFRYYKPKSEDNVVDFRR